MRHRLAVWLLWLLALVTAIPASATSYVYDANGRVIAVTNDAGESARYVYDVMGNITRVDRLAVGELALFAFTPGRGVSGMQVTLKGHAFSTEPTANVVRFAGTEATVLRATSSELVVLVPAGAVTGAITVTVGAQSVSSSTEFIVDQNARLPQIDGFTPQIASAGTQIAVTGESLYPIAHQTTVRIGTRAGRIGTAQSQQLDFVVPTLAASGKVSVSTPYGMAVSEQDLVVLPPGVNAADIARFQRITPDAPARSFAIESTGQQVAILVDAAVGEYLDVQLSQISGVNFNYSLYDPSNRSILAGALLSYDPTLLLPPAASAGTYLLLLKPNQGPASWNLAIERSRRVVPGGESLSVVTSALGQKKRLIFSATLGQHLGVGLDQVVTSDGNGFSNYVMQRDTSVTSTYCYPSYVGCGMNVHAAQAGVHAIVLSPSSNQTIQARVSLSDDIRHTLQRGVPLDLTVPRRGQNARLDFVAQAGESLALQVVAQVTQPVDKYVNYSVYKPDGTLLTSATTYTHQLINLPNLPQSGQYVVFVDADQAVALTSRVMLSEGGGGQVDGDSGEFSTQDGGQSIYFNFDVTEVDQRIGVGISDLVLSEGSYVSAYVYAPDGTSVASATCYPERGGCGLNIRAPRVGRYSVVVQPVSQSQTMAMRAWVSSDLQAVMTRETPLQLDIARRGQNARLYVDAQAGETLAIQIAGQVTAPSGGSVYYQLYSPDGTLFTSTYASSAETVRMPTLAASGRYMLFVDPYYGEAVQARVTLTAGQQAGMVIDGAQGEFVAPIAGHPGFLTFTTTVADQRLGLGLTEMELSTGSYFSVYVYGPDGTHVTSTSCYASQLSCALNIRAGLIGTYSVLVTPQSGDQLVKFKASLSNDHIVQMVREEPLELVIPRFGQNARLRFTAQAGENLALHVTGQTTADGVYVPYQVYRPDGTLMTSINPTTYDQLTLMNLPQSGEYFVFVDPYYGSTLQARVLLTAGNGGEPIVDGEEAHAVTSVGGQATFATFEVEEVDQRIGVGISDLLMSSGSYASVYIYRPSGGTVTSTTCYASTEGCELNLRAPEVGTYGVVLIPQSASQTLDYTLTVSNDLRRVLPRETPIAMNLPRRGQNGRLTFNAQAGETLGLQITGQSTVPVGTYVYYQVYRPDGSMLVSASALDFTTLNLPTLAVTGEYMLFVDPSYGATVAARVTLTTGEGSGTVVDGNPGDFSTQPGQPTYMTFQAAAGEQLGLGISDLVLSSGSYASVVVYQPGGSTLTSTTCYASVNGCLLAINAVNAGTYSVVITPQSTDQTAQFKVTVSRDLRLALERNVPLDFAIARRGQKARLSFSGEAGEVLSLQVTGQTTYPAGRTVYYQVYRPDGSWLGSVNTSTFGAQELRLPMSGSYEVRVETNYGETVESRVTLVEGEAVNVGSAPLQVATQVGGQAAQLTFQATAGQQLGIGIHDLSVSADSYVSVVVYRPDGASVTSNICYAYNEGCKLSVTASHSGTYSVLVTPQNATQTFVFGLSLSEDVTAVLQPDQPIGLALSRRGQNGRLTFAGQAGQWLSLQVAGQVTSPTARTVYYRVYAPDGTYLNSFSTSSYGAIRMDALPQTGTYSVMVDPGLGETVQVQVTLASGSSALGVDGASVDVETTSGGQEVFLSFNATQGQRLGIGLTDVEISSDSYFIAYLYGPSASTSAVCYGSYGGCEMDMTATATGVHRLYLVPISATQKIKTKVTVSTDVEATLVRGTPLSLSLERPGQNGWVGFEGSAGEVLTLHLDDHTTQPAGGNVYYVIYNPDGSALTSININGDRALQLPTLPADGRYHIRVTPNEGMPLAVGLRLL